MSLRYPRMPLAVDVARRAFREHRSDPLPGIPPLADRRVSPALPLWTAPFRVALENAIATHAFPRGWRAFAFGDKDAVAADLVARGDEIVAARIFAGETVTRTLDALALAEEIEQKDEDVPVRILDVPSLFFTAVWILGAQPRCVEVFDDREPRARQAAEVFEDLAQFARERIAASEAAAAHPPRAAEE